MYKINGYFPLVRCVCGRSCLLKRATVCGCRATLRVKYGPGLKAHPYGLIAVEHETMQPHKLIEITGWVKA
jgi:hypothetical protein